MMWKQTLKISLCSLAVLLLMPAAVYAVQSSSTNYQVNEVFFGSGGELNACSGNYCSKQSAGELVTGRTSSNGYQAQGGFNTNREPYLEFIVSNNVQNVGEIEPNQTKTANANFSVKTYLASGYVVTTESDPPTNGSHALSSPSIPTSSNVGTEQFAMNLVANTFPASYGANPVQVPNNSYSFGQVSNDYNIPNQYKYTKGDTIAFSNSSSSTTNYTISYIFNVSNVSPGGTYTMNHVLVATSTF